jgi:hypothetical protein
MLQTVRSIHIRKSRSLRPSNHGWTQKKIRERGGKDVLNGAKFIVKWGQITI